MSFKNASRPVIGVGVLVWRNKKLLLGKRLLNTRQLCDQQENQSFCWQFPGGHLENNESTIECAQREVREETGLEIMAMRHIGMTNKTFLVAGRQYITLLVSSEYQSGEVKTLEPDKCGGWQWFDYRQLPTPLFEPINLFLAQNALTQSISDSATRQQGDLYAMHEAASELSDTPSSEHK